MGDDWEDMGMNVESGIRGDSYTAYESDEEQARKRRLIIISAIVAAALIAAYIGYRVFFHKPAPAAAPAAPSVTVIIPGKTSIVGSVTANGSLAAKREMPVGVAGEGGMVQRVLVEPGDWVKAGQTLAIIEQSVQAGEANSAAASVRVARADANIAQSDLDRAKALVARGFISRADLDRKTATRDAAIARVAVAQAQYGQSRARLGRLDIRSPADGLVLTRAVEPGQVVSSGNGALFRVAKSGEMEVRAQLAEQDLSRLHVGDRVKVTPVGASQSFIGHIWQLSPIIDPATRQGIARVQLAYNPMIRPGGFASVDISRGKTSAPLLPESAVLSDQRGNFVYIITPDNKVARRDVKVGDVSDQGISVLSGLSGTEKVVYSAGAFLNPGDKVTPVAKTAR